MHRKQNEQRLGHILAVRMRLAGGELLRGCSEIGARLADANQTRPAALSAAELREVREGSNGTPESGTQLNRFFFSRSIKACPENA